MTFITQFFPKNFFQNQDLTPHNSTEIESEGLEERSHNLSMQRIPQDNKNRLRNRRLISDRNIQHFETSVEEGQKKKAWNKTAIFPTATIVVGLAASYFLGSHEGISSGIASMTALLPAIRGENFCHSGTKLWATDPLNKYTGTIGELQIDRYGNLCGENAAIFSSLKEYAWEFDTWDAIQPDFKVFIQTEVGAVSQGNMSRFEDRAFDKKSARTIDNAILALTWSLTECRDPILSKGYERARSNIAMPQEKLSTVIDELLHNTLAIGGFYNPRVVGFTFSQIFHNHDQQLFAINILDAPRDLDRITGTLFHEILHNWGFSHNSNDPTAYQDRTKAILALQDVMQEFVRDEILGKCSQEDFHSCSLFGRYPIGELDQKTWSEDLLPKMCRKPSPHWTYLEWAGIGTASILSLYGIYKIASLYRSQENQRRDYVLIEENDSTEIS
ncbi:MAG: hypothetical protein ACI9S8_001777 [Chlamydiales bacterium]|jgi:hypothetical protein